MNTHEIIGPKPGALVSDGKGQVVFWHEDYDFVLDNWIVSARRGRVMFFCRWHGWLQIAKPFGTN